MENRVTLITTVKNEEKSIGIFINSLFSQTKIPDEVIIVDGGSTDSTVDIIKSHIDKNERIELIVRPGVNIAEGRNIAIKRAKYEIIAVTDAGCQLDIDWLKNIVKPFEDDPNVDVVSGWYLADARNGFEECVAELTYPKLENVLRKQDMFLPSSRSVAYKKDCWAKVGGYPEWLYTAEDTLFDMKLKENNCKFFFQKDAIVKWRVRSNIKSVFKQYFLYAKGDSQAKLFFNIYKITFFIYAVSLTMLVLGVVIPILWLFLTLCIVIYITIPTIRILWKTRKYSNCCLTPVLIITIDLAKIIGYLAGKL